MNIGCEMRVHVSFSCSVCVAVFAVVHFDPNAASGPECMKWNINLFARGKSEKKMKDPAEPVFESSLPTSYNTNNIYGLIIVILI